MPFLNQAVATTGNRRLRRNQMAELDARLSYLPQILHAEQSEKQRKEENAFKKAALAQEKKMAKDTLKQQREESRKGMGLEAIKLGTTLANSNLFGSFGSKATTSAPKGFAAQNAAKLATSAGRSTTAPGLFSGMNWGGAAKGGITGGSIGFGIGSMMGKGKEKWIGAGLGALAGSALGGGLLSGGGGGGGLFSGVGDFFKGLF